MLLLVFVIFRVIQALPRKTSTAQAMYGKHGAFVQIDKPSSAC